MQNIKLVIFDMDGLMFDTERIAYRAWKQAGSKYGFDINQELFNQMLGTNLEKTKEILIGHFGENFPIDKIAEDRFIISEDIIEANGVPVKEGLYDLLLFLTQNNILKAVATSTSRARANKLLQMANVYSSLDYIICGDEVQRCKPNPEIYLKAAEQLGCTPDECLVLEDSYTGIRAAKAAGMYTIMIPDLKQPDEDIIRIIHKQLNSLKEVKDFLNSYIV